MTALSKIALAILIVLAFVIGVTLQPLLLLLSAVQALGWTLMDAASPAYLLLAKYWLLIVVALIGVAVPIISASCVVGRLSPPVAGPLLMALFGLLALLPLITDDGQNGDGRPPETSPSTHPSSVEL